MLPLLGMAAGSALSAGVNGVKNLVNGQDQEEQAKKQALMNLSKKFQAGNDSSHQFGPAPEIPKAPGFVETVVAPMATAATSNALGSALGGLGKSSAPSPSPMADPHADYEKDFGASMKPGVNPAAMPGEDEQDFYVNATRRALGRS